MILRLASMKIRLAQDDVGAARGDAEAERLFFDKAKHLEKNELPQRQDPEQHTGIITQLGGSFGRIPSL